MEVEGALELAPKEQSENDVLLEKLDALMMLLFNYLDIIQSQDTGTRASQASSIKDEVMFAFVENNIVPVTSSVPFFRCSSLFFVSLPTPSSAPTK